MKMSADKKTNTKDHNKSESLWWRVLRTVRLNGISEDWLIETWITMIESRWEGVRIPNHNSIEQVKNRISYLGKEIEKLKEKRPDCAKLMGDFERNFKDYSKLVRELIAHKSETIKILEDLGEEPSNDLLEVKDILNRSRVATKRQRSRLILLRQGLERKVLAYRNSNIKDQLKGSEELTNELQSYANILNQLKKHTHQWKDIMQTIPLPPYSRPDQTRVARVVIEHECTKCGKIEIVANDKLN